MQIQAAQMQRWSCRQLVRGLLDAKGQANMPLSSTQWERQNGKFNATMQLDAVSLSTKQKPLLLSLAGHPTKSQKIHAMQAAR